MPCCPMGHNVRFIEYINFLKERKKSANIQIRLIQYYLAIKKDELSQVIFIYIPTCNVGYFAFIDSYDMTATEYRSTDSFVLYSNAW